MIFDTYQEKSKHTVLPQVKDNISYYVMGLAGEAGEVANLVKKQVRDLQRANATEVALELGDVLWYVTRIAEYFGFSLEDIAQMNIQKLAERYKQANDRNRTD
jgi:NTP pyrophosphatase (non-canonical NTP hydrolase)